VDTQHLGSLWKRSDHPDLIAETRLFFLERMKDAFSQQRKASPTIPLSFDQFELGDVSLNHPVIDPPSEAGSCE